MRDGRERSFRDLLAEKSRLSKGFIVGLILLVVLVNSLDLFAPPLGIPLTLLLIWLLLWLTRGRWRDLGMRRPPHWGRAIALGVGGAILLQLVAWLVVVPLLRWMEVELPDYSRFEAIRGNPAMLLMALIVSWTTAGFGEEIIDRGFMMTHVARLFGDGRAAWMASLIVVSVYFGLAHSYQGTAGVVLTGFAGFVLGALYIGCGRNLWPSIIAHGLTDTASFLALYFGLLHSM